MTFSGRKDWAQDYMEGIFQLAAMRLCSTTLPQLAIPAALKDMESTKAMMRPGGRLYEQSAATMRELEKIEGISCVKNNAAFYVFPKLDIKKFNISSDKKFAFDLLHQKHILIVPGSGFDWTTPDHFRIVMLPDAERMAQAIRDIGDFLKDYRQ
jgi:alanine-synthesizing transaminase